jgi:predicted secreted protein
MNKCILVCHCVLDPVTRAEGTKPISRDIIKVLVDKDIGIIQIKCPELEYEGFSRPPCNKEDYDTGEYRELCREIAVKIVDTIKKYQNAGIQVLGLISIGGSPSCGCQRTHVKGEHVAEPGVFIEELQNVLQEQGVKLRIVDHELLQTESEMNKFFSC